MHKMQKIPTRMVGIELVGGGVEELRERLEMMDVGLDGARRAIAQFEIVDETLPQRCHEGLQ